MQLGSIIAVLCSAAVLAVPRSWVVPLFLFGVIYCPATAGLDVAGLNFPPGRLLAFAGLMRLILRGEFPSMGKPDLAALAFGVTYVTSGLFHEGPAQAVLLRCGYVLEIVGGYFVFRGFIKSHQDLVRCFVSMILLLVPVSLSMLWESRTGDNLFSYFGALGESNVRNGRIRAQGPFRHAILAGTFAAALFPIAVGMLWERRKIAVVGMIAVLAAVFACASSGPIFTLAAGVGGLALWNYRRKLRCLLWILVGVLFALHVVMKDPVWFLIARVDIVGGSTGWHRSKLIDQAINHFDEWWFAGTDKTKHWMPSSHQKWSDDHIDITNYYVKCAVIGGLVLLLSFIWLLKRCFSEIAFSIHILIGKRRNRAFCYWCVGVWLFAHAVSMISVNYYDQSLVLFYALTGVVASAGEVARKAVPLNELSFCKSEVLGLAGIQPVAGSHAY